MQQRAYLVASVLAMLALTGFACDDLPPGEQPAALSGTVTDSSSKKPLMGVTVTVDAVIAATTDANGKYAIAKVPSGIVDYTVGLAGYTTISASANAEPGKPLEIDLSLDPAPQP